MLRKAILLAGVFICGKSRTSIMRFGRKEFKKGAGSNVATLMIRNHLGDEDIVGEFQLMQLFDRVWNQIAKSANHSASQT